MRFQDMLNLYAHPTLAAIYDVTCGWSEDQDYYLNLAKNGNQSILDIGCGTGLLCRAYAKQGNSVVGLDPSEPMLAVAREKSRTDSISYIQGTANEVGISHPGLAYSFDLVIMTGHAFQCITSESAVIELFNCVKRWLKAGGRIVFETRNPGIDWVSQWHGASSTLDSEFGQFQWSTHVIAHSKVGNSIDTITYKHLYEFENETLSGGDTLRFMQLSNIKILLEKAGFGSITVYGDWNDARYDTSESEEMIFHAVALR